MVKKSLKPKKINQKMCAISEEKNTPHDKGILSKLKGETNSR